MVKILIIVIFDRLIFKVKNVPSVVIFFEILVTYMFIEILFIL